MFEPGLDIPVSRSDGLSVLGRAAADAGEDPYTPQLVEAQLALEATRGRLPPDPRENSLWIRVASSGQFLMSLGSAPRCSVHAAPPLGARPFPGSPAKP